MEKTGKHYYYNNLRNIIKMLTFYNYNNISNHSYIVLCYSPQIKNIDHGLVSNDISRLLDCNIFETVLVR